MNFFSTITLLTAEAERLAHLAPSATWFLFGSALNTDAAPNDLDVLIVYRNDQHAVSIHQHINLASVLPPIHLLLMRQEEENELKFRDVQNCVEFFPNNLANPKGP